MLFVHSPSVIITALHKTANGWSPLLLWWWRRLCPVYKTSIIPEGPWTETV